MKVLLANYFTGDYYTVISSYVKRIQYILNNYDVAIFMARKAICMYQALVKNGELYETSCRVISSRVVDYNSMDNLRGIHIAVIDDVVIKGESLNRVAEVLSLHQLQADYYVAVCERNFPLEFNSKGFDLQQSYAHYTLSQVYQMAGQITRYIEASMCTFNIDSPIYDVTLCKEKIKRLLNETGAANISSSLQNREEIEARVLFLDIKSNAPNMFYTKILERAVIKIRFYFEMDQAIAVPFVLLPVYNKQEFDLLRTLVSDAQIENITFNENARVADENRIKLVSYLLSEALFAAFARQFDVLVRKISNNDIYQFNNTTESFVPTACKTAVFDTIREVRILPSDFSTFQFSNYVREFYKYISRLDIDKLLYEDKDGISIRHGKKHGDSDNKLHKIVFTYEDIRAFFAKATDYNCPYYVSLLIDVFIDRGVIVPSIVHLPDGTPVRSYKMGEYSKLTREQVNAFARMLYEYQESVKRELDKTEFEKMCVLFFRALICQKQFIAEDKYEDGAYSIGYSLYGPRVSHGETLYRVDRDSAIITDLIENQIVLQRKGKYTIIRMMRIDERALEWTCMHFARDYGTIAQVFKTHPYIAGQNNPWNQYIHTYIQYLTILAIGDIIKNQILSLCAEVNQMLIIKTDIFWQDIKKLPINTYRQALSGINSGLWKYLCFKGRALERTNEQISRYNWEATRGLTYLTDINNQDPALVDKMDRIGKLLFRAAFFLSEALQARHRVSYFQFKNIDGETNGSNKYDAKGKGLFSVPYYKFYSEDRHHIEDYFNTVENNPDLINKITNYWDLFRNQARAVLDWCDLYLARNNSNITVVKQFLIIYDSKGTLKSKFQQIRGEVILEKVTIESKVRVFPIINETDKMVLIDKCAAAQDIDDVVFLLFNLKEDWESIVVVDDIAKGTYIRHEIDSLLRRCDEEVKQQNKLLYYVSNKSTPCPSRCVKTELVSLQEMVWSERYRVNKYIIRRQREMPESGNVQTNNFNGTVIANEIITASNIGNVGIVSRLNKEDINYWINMIMNCNETLTTDQRKAVEDNLSIIKEQAQSKRPDKNLLTRALNSLKNICKNESFLKAVAGLTALVKVIIDK